jgi:hypothetical protein
MKSDARDLSENLWHFSVGLMMPPQNASLRKSESCQQIQWFNIPPHPTMID